MASTSNNMTVVRLRKLWFLISGVLIALSVYGLIFYGFNESIDFTGGTLTEVSYAQGRPDLATLEAEVEKAGFVGASVLPTGANNYTIRTKDLSQGERASLSQNLGVNTNGITVVEQTTVGPTAGAELKSKAYKAITVVVIMIVLFVTFAFRRVSRPVASWKYGLATIIALAHDVIIPTGVFIFLGHLRGTQIDLLFVTGLLAILGYSVHDTIVVFDRVRENLRLQEKNESFEATVGKSVTQTFGRSINTSLTIFITLLALYLLGPATTHNFALLLIVGVIVGTYSSIFVASPLLVTFYNWQKNK